MIWRLPCPGILAFLESRFGYVRDWLSSRRREDPFRMLVLTILSQITSSANMWRAYKRLEESVGVDPRNILEAPLPLIEEAIKPAGLWRRRAVRLKEVAGYISKLFPSGLGVLKREATEAIREKLLKIPGVGDKTADVMLLFSFGRPVMPVDTHIIRISKRLGLVAQRAKYREIREALEHMIPKSELAFAHLALIEFGRKICIAGRPRCNLCALRCRCEYYRKVSAGGEDQGRRHRPRRERE